MSIFTETKTLKSLKLVPELDIIITEHEVATLKDGVVITKTIEGRSYSNNQIEDFEMEVALAGASIADIVTSFNAAAIEQRDASVAALTVAQDALAVSEAKVASLQAQIDAYTPPVVVAPMVPGSVTMRQARLALLGADLLGLVDAAIAALPSPQKEAAQIEWQYASTVERNSGLLPAMGAALGLTDEQLDALFETAKTL